MDVFPTFMSLAEVPIPEDRILDGYDLTPVLSGEGSSGRNSVLYYRGTEIYAARLGVYKAHFITRPEYGAGDTLRHDPPLLYNLEHDPSEKYDIAEAHPDVLERISRMVEEHKQTVEPVTDQLAIPLGEELQ